MLENEIETRSIKRSKVIVKLNKTLSKELIFNLNPSKLGDLKLILVNGENLDLDSIDTKSPSLTINTPEFIEFYIEQFSSNKDSESLRLVERIEFK